MPRHLAPLVGSALVALLAACSSPPPTTVQAAATTSAGVRVLASATPGSTAPAATGRFVLGQAADLTQVTIAVTQVLRKEGPGDAHIGAQIAACVAPTAPAPAAFTIGSWSVAGADGRTAKAAGTDWGVAATPDTPIGDALVEPGSCGTGLVVFDSGGDFTPSKVFYRNATGTALTWELPTG